MYQFTILTGEQSQVRTSKYCRFARGIIKMGQEPPD